MTDVRYDHGEGPVWDVAAGQLSWVDLHVGAVVVGEWDAAAGSLRPARTISIGAPVGAALPAEGGGWVVAAGRGFARVTDDGAVRWLADPAADAPPGTRMNDGKCDRHGRFWAGSIADGAHPGTAALYRFDPDGQVSTALEGVTVSNGLDWTADGTTLYYIDTPTHRVDAFTVAPDGSLLDRRPVVEIPDDTGMPDGMTVDAEGALWVALWSGRAVHRYAPDGSLLAIVDVDAERVSSCCFGGPGLDVLFITTSQEGMTSGERAAHPNTGRLFAAHVGVTGRPMDRFGTA